MQVVKSSSGYEIFDSGTLISFSSSSDIKIAVKCSESFAFDILFKFEAIEGEEYSLKKEVIDSTSTIQLTCINFNNTLGTGTTQPIELATFNGKKIYINFWISALSDNALKKLEYNLYKEI